ncbi:MAG TPA: flagellar basal body-associated FliL family protein [Azospirillaceae bacterium]|nr:flagellar basal body-associated FliL family protein [Azospirillaceae bacterium]HRQ79989.1 flagellar basal body-associated FliL family protein [Azospirillaceae bacterium]
MSAAPSRFNHSRLDRPNPDRPRPDPLLDRRAPLRPAPTHDHDRHANIIVTASLMLIALLALAAFGGFMWLAPSAERQRIEAIMGPRPNLAPLPTMKMEMGGAGGLAMDLTLVIELDPGVRPAVVEPYIDRITDRMGDRLRDAGLERLAGTEGALLVKEMARSVAQQELGRINVRDVLIESMVVRSGYSSALPARSVGPG